MKILLIYPRFPQSFWSFEQMLALLDRKALLPPLGLITVAAILPQKWDYKLVDRNVRDVTSAEWDWADLVILSAMIVQKQDLADEVKRAKKRDKLVAVGGPYATALPDEVVSMGADFLILDEGEITLPLFIKAIREGQISGVFRSDGERPDVTATPIPRFDLLEFGAYAEMSVQFSRGCPFQCEFCDIIVLYGRKPRTKTPRQLIQELDALNELGWRGSVFMVDDNFIGNKRNVKLLLPQLKVWMEEHRYPFSFSTEASVDLAQDQELMDSMVECNFRTVFLGIETPDEDSLALTRKYQNTRDSLGDSVNAITRSGLRVMAGFIIGFDGEKKGAGQRIAQFVEETSIPTAMLGMLQALPNTALWHRLAEEGRLRSKSANINLSNQTALMNFVPTRPLEDIAHEFVDAFDELYDPASYLDRVYRHYCILGRAKYPMGGKSSKKPVDFKILRALSKICWRQGMLRRTRWQFWHHLIDMIRVNRDLVASYLSVCAHIEHFLDYRQIVKHQIQQQLAEYLDEEASATCGAIEESPAGSLSAGN